MIPENVMGIRRKNEIFLAVSNMVQPFTVSIPPRCMKQDTPKEWFAIRTKPQQEQIAKLHYERQGYVVYLPMMRVIVRHARRTEEKLKPFFPGYLFLRLALPERNWVAAISSIRGVLGPICRPRKIQAEQYPWQIGRKKDWTQELQSQCSLIMILPPRAYFTHFPDRIMWLCF
jgi:hypothetical protein